MSQPAGRRLSDISLRWKILGSFGLILVVLAGIAIASYRTTLANERADDDVAHSLLIISETNSALAVLLDMETGYRGYLITGQESFLDPYTAGRQEFDDHMANLIAETRDNPSQSERWQEIARDVEIWQNEIAEPLIALRRTAGSDQGVSPEIQSRVGSGEGKQQIDAIRQVFAEALTAEDDLLEERQAVAAAANTRLQRTVIAGSVIAVGLSILLAWLLSRDITGGVGRLAHTAERIADGQLGERIAMQRGDEIGVASASFDRMADQLQATIERSELQSRDLARSNAELEQFAYVASHDLQEPLRSVVSYVQLLDKRYSGKLDERADKYIAYAVDGGRRMQILINDLLTYSRVGRRGADLVPIDSGEALQRALSNLAATIEESNAIVTHDPLPTVDGDIVQIVQLFQNLIGNAVKFHGDTPPAVHVSATLRTDDWLFAVRDNGIGISPEYADRIFVIFQRLHGRDEYEGTGIGLAICKKIVERHGGQLWVESSDGEGSTFYFTLPHLAEQGGGA